MSESSFPDLPEAQRLNEAEQQLGHQFTCKSVLLEAFTHASWPGGSKNYERLEFLGDRVLGLVLTHHLFDRFPEADQGELTKRYHQLSNESALAEICRAMNLERYIIHEASPKGLNERESVQSDVVEAVIAALYIDGGLEAARRFILANWNIPEVLPADIDSNPKSELQEWAAGAKHEPPIYQLIAQTGSDHEPLFEVSVEVARIGESTGEGQTRKQAEKQAAKRFLLRHVYKKSKDAQI